MLGYYYIGKFINVALYKIYIKITELVYLWICCKSSLGWQVFKWRPLKNVGA